jgi:hypothetical protein
MTDVNTGFPTFQIPQIFPSNNRTLRPRVEYPRSWGWNFETGEIVTDGLGRPVEVDGFRSMVIWCVVAALTHRYDHIIYDPQFGTELPEALAQPTDDLVQSAIRRTIQEALSVDDRVGSVENFVFSQENDILYVDFDVRSAEDAVEHITLGFPAP